MCGLTEPIVHVYCRCGAFEDAECTDDRRRHAILGLVDFEILEGAFGLRAPIFGGIDLDLAKGVRFCSSGLWCDNP